MLENLIKKDKKERKREKEAGDEVNLWKNFRCQQSNETTKKKLKTRHHQKKELKIAVVTEEERVMQNLYALVTSVTHAQHVSGNC